MENKNYIKYFVLFIFAVSALFFVFQREPFWDEANSWLIAQNFSFLELFKIEKYDGHLFIWHLLQMPFAKNNFFYPYSIYLMNLFFCLIALFVFWNKAPFSTLEKTLITFSYPFALYFAPVARCYSIGLLFLFLILSIWNERLKHPVLISILLILFSNTSAMALIGSLPLTLIFSYDLIKSKSKNITPFIILFFGFFLVYIQLFGAEYPDPLFVKGAFYKKFEYFFVLFSDEFGLIPVVNKLCALCVLYLYSFGIFYFQKSKRAIFFFVLTNILLFFLFIFKYPGQWWHYLFFFIYFIVSIWLLRVEGKEPDSKIKKFFCGFFISLLILFSLKTVLFKWDSYPFLFKSRGKEIADTIKKENLFKENDKIYTYDSFSESAVGIIPYFNGTLFYDIFGNKKYTYESYKHNMYDQTKPFDVDKLVESFDKTKRNICITSYEIDNEFEGEKYGLILKPLYKNKGVYFMVYEMTPYEK